MPRTRDEDVGSVCGFFQTRICAQHFELISYCSGTTITPSCGGDVARDESEGEEWLE